MNKKMECKIIQDLLPNFVDGLTDSEVTKYIEEHLNSCEECRKYLEEMQAEIDIDKIETKKEIDGLKKFKRIQRLKIVLTIIIVIFVCFGLFQLYTRYHVEVNENGEWHIVSSRADYHKSHITYIIYETKIINKNNSKDGYIYSTILLAINDNKCISAKIIEKGYANIEQQYNNIINSNLQIYGDVKLHNDSIIYNDNYLTGKDRNKVKEIINHKYEIIESIEL